jgi:hypothetical protein
MKLKALLLALFTAGFAVSIAVAASPAALEKGKPTTSTSSTDTTGSTSTETTGKKGGKGTARKPVCKPARKIQLQGTYVAAASGGFAMAITGGNKPAKAWKGKQATVLVDDKTRVHGAKRALADLAAGDRIGVQGYACKADAAAGTVLARKVQVKGSKGEDTPTTTGTTTTGTTTGTTTTGTTTGTTTTTG